MFVQQCGVECGVLVYYSAQLCVPQSGGESTETPSPHTISYQPLGFQQHKSLGMSAFERGAWINIATVPLVECLQLVVCFQGMTVCVGVYVCVWVCFPISSVNPDTHFTLNFGNEFQVTFTLS